MRIIAGLAKGIILKEPASITRPTMDRVRAAVFSMLGERVLDAHVLDLFAGTGAMGLEALSRGAASATLVDNHTGSVEVIRKNLVITRLQGDAKQMDALAYLSRIAGAFTFDLIFADPPYPDQEGNNLAISLLKSPHLLGALAEGGLLILECERKQILPEIPELEILADRRYGITRIVIMRAL